MSGTRQSTACCSCMIKRNKAASQIYRTGGKMSNIYDQDLPQTEANYSVLTPLSFIKRTAEIYPAYPAVVHGFGDHAIRYDWATLYRRCRQLASALANAGVKKGDTVAVMLPNTPAM